MPGNCVSCRANCNRCSAPIRGLDVVMGAQMGAFSGQSTFDAFNSAWTLDTRADRMGIRLLGPALVYQGAPMISEGIPLGAIQVPPDGQPIVLLNDRQTIGGYPRLGALTPLALARLAQCLPGRVCICARPPAGGCATPACGVYAAICGLAPFMWERACSRFRWRGKAGTPSRKLSRQAPLPHLPR